ncbi:MAG: CDP-alcohol phosphatidyltransferase family protein [Gemmatimonadales bacterium]
MIDGIARPYLQRLYHPLARRLVEAGVSPLHLTLLGAGIAALATSVVLAGPPSLGVAIWLLGRIPDGLDGAVARLGNRVTLWGAYLDTTLDMAAYSAMIVALGLRHPELAVAWLLILVGYVLCSASTLALSSLLERQQQQASGEQRSIQYTRGLAEAGETYIVYGLFVLMPSAMSLIAWGWVIVLGITFVERTMLAARLLRG